MVVLRIGLAKMPRKEELKLCFRPARSTKHDLQLTEVGFLITDQNASFRIIRRRMVLSTEGATEGTKQNKLFRKLQHRKHRSMLGRTRVRFGPTEGL